MKSIPLVPVLFFALVFISGRSGGEETKYTLKSRFPEGTYDIKIVSDMDMLTTVGDQFMPMKQVQTQTMKIVAGPIEANGLQKVVMEFKRVAIDQKMMEMEMKYDSDDEKTAASPLAAMGIMVGLKLTMYYDKDGKIQKTEGWDEFMQALLDNAKPDQKQVFEMMKEQMTPETLTKNIAAGQDSLPDKPVVVGENWKKESSMEIPMLGTMSLETDNTLQGVEEVDGKKVAEIVTKTEARTAEAKEIEMGPVKMAFKNISIQSDTTLKLDVDAELIFSSVAKMKLSMEMDLAGLGEAAAPKISGTGTTTTSVTPVKP